MKLVRFQYQNEISYGVLEGEKIRRIAGDIFDEFTCLEEWTALRDVTLLAPCMPSKVVAVGLNYSAHAEEMKDEIPDFPALFLKPATAVIGPDETIIYPEMSKQVDYEAELAVVIKKKAHHIAREEVPEYVLGYTCLNDVTARDLQRIDSQWMRAKSFDTFAPLGPVIETDFDPAHAEIKSYLNGELRQHSNTEHFIFPVEMLVSTVSQIMTLHPGDVITTGTPSGIGSMRKGDVIEIEIEGIGILRNVVG